MRSRLRTRRSIARRMLLCDAQFAIPLCKVHLLFLIVLCAFCIRLRALCLFSSLSCFSVLTDDLFLQCN